MYRSGPPLKPMLLQGHKKTMMQTIQDVIQRNDVQLQALVPLEPFQMPLQQRQQTTVVSKAPKLLNHTNVAVPTVVRNVAVPERPLGPNLQRFQTPDHRQPIVRQPIVRQPFFMSLEVIDACESDKTECLVYVTHVWNASIEATFKAIQSSTSMDIFILVGPHGSREPIELDVGSLCVTVLRPSLAELQSMYPTGFVSMWASNHLLLMWFWRQYAYDYVWSMEYDVRFKGPLQSLWTLSKEWDYLYSDLRDLHGITKSHYWASSIEPSWHKNQFQHFQSATKQVCRLSRKFLDHLEASFQQGQTAQDEVAFASHCFQQNFKSKSLKDFLSDSWTTSSGSSARIEKLWQNHQDQGLLVLFHPVK